jgi:hypothetical protein
VIEDVFNIIDGGGRWAGKNHMLKVLAKKAALDNGGMITIARIDRETGKVVTDEITFDMPFDEIIL